MDSKIIEAMQGTGAKWQVFDDKMKIAALRIGIHHFEGLNDYGKWVMVSRGCKFIDENYYRLKQDYAPEQEIVECEIKPDTFGHLRYDIGSDKKSIHLAVTQKNFIGFKYENGTISPVSRLYIDSKDYVDYEIEPGAKEMPKILTPTHVLFSNA